MDKKDIIEILSINGYSQHPIFGFFCKKKTMMGYVFCLLEEKIIVNRVSSGNININNPTKEYLYKQFNPHIYGLATPKDIKWSKLKMLKAVDDSNRNRKKSKVKSKPIQQPEENEFES